MAAGGGRTTCTLGREGTGSLQFIPVPQSGRGNTGLVTEVLGTSSGVALAVIKKAFSVMKPAPIRPSVPGLNRATALCVTAPKANVATIQRKDQNKLQAARHGGQVKHVRVVVVQPKFAPVPGGGHGTTGRPGTPGGCRFAPVPQFGQVQPVVQAKAGSGQPRFYPNLNPAAAAIKADPTEFLRLERGFDESYYRMRRGGDHGLMVPNSRFIFVRTMDGDVVMHQRYRHPVLAQGRPVLYAGEASFNNGKLDWWSNGSGNYRPDSDHAEQAALPMERFFTYEQVLKGTNKQGRQPAESAE